jgi:acyl dehydratase
LHRFGNLDELAAAAGTDLGYSDWVVVNQERIDRFAAATGDFQWIHTDHDRAKSSQFGGTIAHGYLTLSMWPALFRQMIQVDGVSLSVNYGAERLRFPSPVRVDSRLRLGVTVVEVVPSPGGVQATYECVLKAEGASKPACAATVLIRYYADGR